VIVGHPELLGSLKEFMAIFCHKSGGPNFRPVGVFDKKYENFQINRHIFFSYF
jgi:hypothetical protein